MVVLILCLYIVTSTESIGKESLIRVEHHAPTRKDTVEKEETHYDNDIGEFPVVGGVCTKIGDGRDDTYHIVPAQSSSVFIFDEEQENKTENEGHIHHHDVCSPQWNLIISSENDVQEKYSLNKIGYSESCLITRHFRTLTVHLTVCREDGSRTTGQS